MIIGFFTKVLAHPKHENYVIHSGFHCVEEILMNLSLGGCKQIDR